MASNVRVSRVHSDLPIPWVRENMTEKMTELLSLTGMPSQADEASRGKPLPSGWPCVEMAAAYLATTIVIRFPFAMRFLASQP